jgi:hypothetical protein
VVLVLVLVSDLNPNVTLTLIPTLTLAVTLNPALTLILTPNPYLNLDPSPYSEPYPNSNIGDGFKIKNNRGYGMIF